MKKKSPASARPDRSLLYRRFARYYDCVFRRLLAPHIHETIRSLDIPAGAKILEVGVGTGLSLPSYPPQASVIGIDVSEAMLRRAARKIVGAEWNHVVVEQMDALDLRFPEEHFDFVTAFHVISVVPDACRAMREMVRVCKTGGTIVIINHFRSENRWWASFVDRLGPLTRRLGWRIDLDYRELLDGAPLRVERRSPCGPAAPFTVLIMRKQSNPLPPPSARPADSSLPARAMLTRCRDRTSEIECSGDEPVGFCDLRSGCDSLPTIAARPLPPTPADTPACRRDLGGGHPING